MEPGHKRGDTQKGFCNLKEWLSGRGREGKHVLGEAREGGWSGGGGGRDRRRIKMKVRVIKQRI